MKSIRILQLAALCGFVVQSLAQSPTNWVVRNPSPDVGELGDITFNEDRWVLADTVGGMLTSPDGRNWSRSAVPSSPQKIVYAEGKYVAITVTHQGSAGEIYTSIDGETWTPRRSTFGLLDVAYANGLFIAIGPESILTSPDGENWTDKSVLGWRLRDVAFGSGTYVIVGARLTPLGDTALVVRSTNAVDWTEHAPPGGQAALFAVAYGNGIFVANGSSGNFLTSSDGSEWTPHGGVAEPPLLPPIGIRELSFGNGYFVASSGNYIYYSTNGTNWTAGCLRCEGPSNRARFYADSIAFGNGQFITANRDGNMYTTTDPMNWSVLRLAEDLNGIAYDGGRFVAVGNDSTVWSSANGREWTYAFAGQKDIGPPDLFGVTFGNDMFVAVGGVGPYIATSRDGLQWTEQEEQALGIIEILRAVAFGNGLFVAAGERLVGPGATTAPKIVISSDGSNWSYPEFTTTTTGFHGVGYGNGVYVVVGNQGAILSSPDGTNWTARGSGTSQTLRAVTYHNGRFLVGGDSGTILTSTDGVNWGPASPTSFSSRGLGSGNGVIAVGNFQNDGRLHYSTDGLGWPGASTSFPQILNGVAYGNGSWVAVGNGGFILQGSSVEIHLSQPRRTGTAFEMTIQTQGQVSSYRIQGSTDLENWETLLTLVSPPQTYLFRDETANTTSNRFYRVVSP